MGERQIFQPLTREDKVTVVLYRSGIAASTMVLAGLAFIGRSGSIVTSPGTEMLAWSLVAAAGMSVFFIHLYVRKFKTYLLRLYFVALACVAGLAVLGKGSLAAALVQEPARAVLLLPLAGCLGFVTAKEAFCFRLLEGYVLAMIMPFFLLLVAGKLLAGSAVSAGMVLIAALHVLFGLRKVFMPLAYDIGDKSAYH